MDIMRRERDSWKRRHHGRVLSLAIWFNGRCEASVYELSGLVRVAQRIPCETSGEARRRADGLLKVAYPHDCVADRCGAWVRFSTAKGVRRA
jgi:hypothetical protein